MPEWTCVRARGAWLLAQLLRHTFESGVHAQEDYWLTFTVTPYSGGWLVVSNITRIFAGQPLTDATERESYLHLVDEYARVLTEIAAKTKAQAARGIRVPQPALAGVRATWTCQPPRGGDSAVGWCWGC